jgi:hypothetical protein
MDIPTALADAVEVHRLQFTRDRTPACFARACMRQVTVSASGFSVAFQIDDEYEDVDDASPALLLNMVLMACTTYEEEDDYLTWCRALGLDASDEDVRRHHMDLGPGVASLRALLPDLRHTSFHDWQLDAGDAQILRRG